MKKPKHRPRRRRARPLLVAAAIVTLSSTLSACNEDTPGLPPYDLTVPTADLGIPPRG